MQFIGGYTGSKSKVPQLTLWLVSNKSSTVWFMLSIKYKPMGGGGGVMGLFAEGLTFGMSKYSTEFVFLCFKLVNIHCHTQSKERNISTKNKLNKNINYNFAISLVSYLAISCTIKLTSNKKISVHNCSYPLGKTVSEYWIPHRIELLREKKSFALTLFHVQLVWTIEMLVFSCFKSD